MRKLLWFTVGFTAVCAVGAYLLNVKQLLILAILLLITLLIVAVSMKGKSKRIVLALAGCVVACIWIWAFDLLYLSHARKFDDQTVNTEVEIVDYSEATQYGISAEGRIILEGRTYRIKVYSYTIASLSPGDVVESAIQLHYTKDTGWSEYFSTSGIFLTGYIDDTAAITAATDASVEYFTPMLRRHILRVLDASFPEDTRAFARALVLGDTSMIDYETDTALSVSGIRHVIAVSGLHVSILFSIIYAVFGYRKILIPVVGFPLLLAFAALAGFTPSVVRACIMQALTITAMMFDKEYDPPTALAFSVQVMLTVNPLAVASVSLQMSVACIAGIFLFGERIRNYLNAKIKRPTKKNTIAARLINWIITCASITLSTMITVTPLCAIYFQTVSLVSVLTNILTLWSVTGLFCGILAVCVLGSICLPAGAALAWLLSWLVRYVLVVADFCASLPLSAVYTQSIYVVLWLVFCYALFVVFLLSKKKRPVIACVCVVLGLWSAVLISYTEPWMDDYRVTVLDVGQGQCILLRDHARNYVIDCGGDYDEGVADLAAQTLLSQGVEEIDGLILTHFDKDHAGGAQYLLSRVPARQIYLPMLQDNGDIKDTITENYSDRICWIENEASLSLEGSGIALFSGDYEKPDKESGLCVLYQSENCDILITGDRDTAGEAALMEQTQLPDLEVLVVGHHGAASSTGLELLNTTRPDVAIISVGGDNRYGHPSTSVLDILTAFDCKVLRTDLNGTIVIRG